ncbi:YncE family protein [Candidatus Entotheonella palauensis]|uniref:YncE family protein n=1 Tax=Candidatus Entotheonella palauensis TaxID=93172 RepID=UPI000B7FE836|nr:cytochrome D1 domain-containing protein [Candidatus Entotheonella palauensis]
MTIPRITQGCLQSPWRQAVLALGALLMLAIFMNAAPASSQPAATAPAASGGQPAPYTEKVVQEGIAVELTIDHVNKPARQSNAFQEGDKVFIRFTLSDTATNSPLQRAFPAAWMDLLLPGDQTTPKQCLGKIAQFLGGGLYSRAELDLNVYYVLALNADSTISVVDPLFGFGGSKLLALIPLQRPGLDWVLTENQETLFVSMPDAHRVAAIDTISWRVVTNLEVGPRPTRLALQPDNAYLWVASGSSQASHDGVTVVRIRDRKIVARIPTGSGPHEIAFDPDSRYAFVTNQRDETVSVIDIRTLKKLKDIDTGARPIALAYSKRAQAVYVAHHDDGTIVAIDGSRHEIVARMTTEAGLAQLRFPPAQRFEHFGIAINPLNNYVYIFDTSHNTIIQSGMLEEEGPDQITFTDELAYIRHHDSEIVLMIPLEQIGAPGEPVPVVDFPGGQAPLGHTSRPSLADAMVQASGEYGVLVANPGDKAIYYYKEGMAAPMGNFSNYGREPRAVLVVERNLRERAAGVYETAVELRSPGKYDIAFFLDSPRMAHCFTFVIDPNPTRDRPRDALPIRVEPQLDNSTVGVGTPVRLQFKLTDPQTHEPRLDLQDVHVLVFTPPHWQQRAWAQHAGDGVYTVDVVLPASGFYTVALASPSLGLKATPYLTLQAKKAGHE